jgi:hypothetical protein
VLVFANPGAVDPGPCGRAGDEGDLVWREADDIAVYVVEFLEPGYRGAGAGMEGVGYAAAAGYQGAGNVFEGVEEGIVD